MMTLERCSKADLLWIINRMCMYSFGKRELDRALADLEYEKEKARIDEADQYAKLSDAKRRAYIDLLKPYAGMKWGDIPLSVLEKTAELQKQAEAADRKWAKLMRVDLSAPKKGVDN